MIEVTGTAKLIVNYVVELDMTEAEFDRLSEKQQNEVLNDAIDWLEVCRNADVDEIEVEDLEEV